MSTRSTRRLTAEDRDGWFRLWRQYLNFYRADLSPATSEHAFTRLSGEEDLNMEGLVAVDAEGGIVGITNIIFHAKTWDGRPACYLEDLFVDPEARGQGIGGQLIEAVYARARERGAANVYWHTQQFNAPARSLYDTVANLTSFVVYDHEL